MAPPPLLILPFAFAGVILRMWLPLQVFGMERTGHLIGWPLLILSIGLELWSVRTMAHLHESPAVYRPTKNLVTSGPFAFSRNPMYLGFVLIHLGLGLVVNTLWHLLLLPVPVILLHYGVIVREERYLEGRFHDNYRRYRIRVRRWI